MYKDNLALLAVAAYGNFIDKNNVDSIQRALLDQDILEKQATQLTLL